MNLKKVHHIAIIGSDYVVIEADEFDRSFHWLRPWMSVITATDPDQMCIRDRLQHLDLVKESGVQFIWQTGKYYNCLLYTSRAGKERGIRGLCFRHVKDQG